MEKYDGVINKPDLDEALEHYGVKGMKWKKHKTPRQRSRESKRLERITGFNRFLRGFTPSQISTDYGNISRGGGTGMSGFEALAYGLNEKRINNELYKRRKKYNGTANSQTGQEGSKLESGIAAGRKRAAKKKK